MDISNISNIINTEYENLSNVFKTELASFWIRDVNILGISTSFPSQYDNTYFKPSYHVNGNFYLWAEWDELEYGSKHYKMSAVFTVGTKENMYQTYKQYVRYYHDNIFQNESGEPFFNVHTWDAFIEGTFQLGSTIYFYTKDFNYTDGDYDRF